MGAISRQVLFSLHGARSRGRDGPSRAQGRNNTKGIQPSNMLGMCGAVGGRRQGCCFLGFAVRFELLVRNWIQCRTNCSLKAWASIEVSNSLQKTVYTIKTKSSSLMCFYLPQSTNSLQHTSTQLDASAKLIAFGGRECQKILGRALRHLLAQRARTWSTPNGGVDAWRI